VCFDYHSTHEACSLPSESARFAQAYALFGAYPEIVFQSVLEETWEDWTARMEKVLGPWRTRGHEWADAVTRARQEVQAAMQEESAAG
jgi:hypothetical protein